MHPNPTCGNFPRGYINTQASPEQLQPTEKWQLWLTEKVFGGTKNFANIGVGCSIVSPSGFLPLPGWVPLLCDFRRTSSPFRGGFSAVSSFVFISYLVVISKYVTITSNVATSAPKPRPNSHS